MATYLRLSVGAIRDEAAGIRSYLLQGEPGGADLPEFTPGAHVDLLLANGMVRSYSLVGDPGDRHTYQVAVLRDANGRGGSTFLWDNLRVGDAIQLCVPRNNFPLHEHAARTILIAGGIGITPMLTMARHLEALGKEWELHYAARSRSAAAFLEALQPYGAKIRFHSDEEAGGFFDMARLVAQAPANAHLYACGPKAMLDAFEASCALRPALTVHLERFSAADVPVQDDQPLTVRLARRGLVFEVPAGTSILDVLLKAGLDIPYSCMEGTCGECQVSVLEGIPDHRDVVLTKKKRAENKVMMLCCSRARTASLTLDI